ncbi:MAG TPA: hypothetical protein VGI92_04720 [Gemmatimonadales bacterium]
MSTRIRGFILPTTLMVMTILTVMLTAAFIMVSAEFRASDNALAIARASALAQAGLEDYLSRNRGVAGATIYDSLRITYGSGYADVVATRVKPQIGSRLAVWLVRSSGVVTSGALLTGQMQAQRSVAQLATLNPGVLPLKGAFVAANPLYSPNTSPVAPINGSDFCGAQDSVALLIATNDAAGATLAGMSPVRQYAGATGRSMVLDSTHVDWASLLAGNFTPDYTVPPWPGWTGYPVLYAPGNLTFSLTLTTAAILVVQGNLTLTSTAQFKGIILVGGHIVVPTSAAGAKVYGAVVTGLSNLVTANSAGTDTVMRGATTFYWDPCEITNALNGMASMAPMRHTFMDTWATY